MMTAHFENLPALLGQHLAQAKHHLSIAICWFSHRSIFEVLLDRLSAGVQVELLLEYDTQNIRDEGLDFQAFIAAGGQLYGSQRAGLMHHKYVIIDHQLLLTGSFNWTYNSNAENLIAIADETVISAFQKEFKRQRSFAKPVFQVCRADLKIFSTFPLFENTRFQLSDLRKKVSHGASVWLVRVDNYEWVAVFKNKLLPFDARQLLAAYWAAYRVWDEELFEHELEGLKNEASLIACRDLCRWARRMQVGDILLATEKRQQVLGLGIVQSLPQPYEDGAFSSCREVQWLKIQQSYSLPERVSGAAVAKFRGSALRVLQEVLG